MVFTTGTFNNQVWYHHQMTITKLNFEWKWVWNLWLVVSISGYLITLCMLIISPLGSGNILALKMLYRTFCKWYDQCNIHERLASSVRSMSIHYGDVIMGAIAFQITSLAIVYSTVFSYADQRKHQSSASLGFVRGIHRRPVNSPHKWPVTGKMFPFDDVIMQYGVLVWTSDVITPVTSNHQLISP